eukprot:7669201-Lingulodinium_polyedra.AAC.1
MSYNRASGHSWGKLGRLRGCFGVASCKAPASISVVFRIRWKGPGSNRGVRSTMMSSGSKYLAEWIQTRAGKIASSK